MKKEITIEQVTRIEGHGKVTIFLNDDGRVDNAHFHVTQVRGFEKFMIGRPFAEAPSLTARTCGICPVSHMLASGKAGDALLAVDIPDTAKKLRQILNYGQIIQSHALNFFYLSAPDLLLGMDADVSKRNLFGMAEDYPELAREGVRMRQFGQQVIERLAGKRIHASWVVPGGVNKALDPAMRDAILADIPEVKAIAIKYAEWFRIRIPDYADYARKLGHFPSLFLGLVNDHGGMEHYNGMIRVKDESGIIIADRLNPAAYNDYIGEAVEPWSFLKFPYYRANGYPDGMYRVGPLARLNIADAAGTPEAEKYFSDFKRLELGAVNSSFFYHYARLIEILHCVERIEELLLTPNILSKHVLATAGVNNFEAVGVTEAPRGILFHHYKVDENGLLTDVNMIIASGNNNLAMNRGVLEAARNYVDGTRLNEGMLNRVEAVVRAFDPCLACSTHTVGKMPLMIDLVSPEGEVLDTIGR